MTDQPIESRVHYVVRLCASVLALDLMAFALAGLVCLAFGVGLTIYNFSTALFIIGILIMIFGMWTGVTGGWRGLGGYATSLELRAPHQYRPSVLSNAAFALAGLLAILCSIIIPLTF